MGFLLVLYIFGIVAIAFAGYFLLKHLIKSAIDESQMAQELHELVEILRNRFPDQNG